MSNLQHLALISRHPLHTPFVQHNVRPHPIYPNVYADSIAGGNAFPGSRRLPTNAFISPLFRSWFECTSPARHEEIGNLSRTPRSECGTAAFAYLSPSSAGVAPVLRFDGRMGYFLTPMRCRRLCIVLRQMVEKGREHLVCRGPLQASQVTLCLCAQGRARYSKNNSPPPPLRFNLLPRRCLVGTLAAMLVAMLVAMYILNLVC